MSSTVETLEAIARKVQQADDSMSSSVDAALLSAACAAELDRTDALASMRAQFHVPTFEPSAGAARREQLYFTGNSLGLQPKLTRTLVDEELASWAAHGVEGHFVGARPWVDTDAFLLQELAEMVGAHADEVAVMNSLTTNLHLFMVAFYAPTAARHKILIESDAFPSDWYAVESQIRLHGLDPATSLIRLAPRAGEHCVREEDIEARLAAENGAVALVLWPGVQYFTGQLFDIARITAAGHRHGAHVGVDLAHAVGNVLLRLHEWQVDFAAWCHYKYVNSGPGAIAGAFVHARHAGTAAAPVEPPLRRLAGWWGHEFATRFQMRSPFAPIPGAAGFRLSNPPVVAVACVLGSLRTFAAVPGKYEALHRKSRLLTGYLELLLQRHVQQRFEPGTLQFLTPHNESQRGCQMSLVFGGRVDARSMHKSLEKRGVVCDFREPGSIRCAPVPLYNSFTDVRDFVAIVIELLDAMKIPMA
jgi:kynureninase